MKICAKAVDPSLIHPRVQIILNLQGVLVQDDTVFVV